MDAPRPYKFTGTELFKWFVTMENYFLYTNRSSQFSKTFSASMYVHKEAYDWMQEWSGGISKIDWETFKDGMVYQFGSYLEVCEWFGFEVVEENDVIEEEQMLDEETVTPVVNEVMDEMVNYGAEHNDGVCDANKKEDHVLGEELIQQLQVPFSQLEPSLRLLREEEVGGDNDVLTKKAIWGKKNSLAHLMSDILLIRVENFKHLKLSLSPKSWKFKFKKRESKEREMDVRLLKVVAIEHPKDANEAATVAVSEIVPLFYPNWVDNSTQTENKTSTKVPERVLQYGAVTVDCDHETKGPIIVLLSDKNQLRIMLSIGDLDIQSKSKGVLIGSVVPEVNSLESIVIIQVEAKLTSNDWQGVKFHITGNQTEASTRENMMIPRSDAYQVFKHGEVLMDNGWLSVPCLLLLWGILSFCISPIEQSKKRHHQEKKILEVLYKNWKFKFKDMDLGRRKLVEDEVERVEVNEMMIEELIRLFTWMINSRFVDSLEKLLKLCNGTRMQVNEHGDGVYPTQETLHLFHKTWNFKFKNSDKRELEDYSNVFYNLEEEMSLDYLAQEVNSLDLLILESLCGSWYYFRRVETMWFYGSLPRPPDPCKSYRTLRTRFSLRGEM